MTTSEMVTGVIEARNDRGIRVGGEWFNQSQFRPVQLPDVGAQVRLEVDAKGFIRSLELLVADSKLSEHTTAGVDREDRIARLTVLKAAANFLGQLSQTREEVKSDHVLVLADKWLEWLNQRHD